jgi:hypothetical protein
MEQRYRSEAGLSLVETMMAIGVLTVGALGMAGVFVVGAQKTVSSPNELIATQKATEAIESVFSARDSHILTWPQLRNVVDNGIFLNGPQPLNVDGPDGVLNTADDGALEAAVLPGPDQMRGTADDVRQTLGGFTREIRIVDLSDDLRSVTVTITHRAGTSLSSYTLTAYISTWA